MRTSHRIGIAALAVAGVLAAAGIGVLATAIAGDSIGLSAEPLHPGSLAPPQAHRTRDDRGSDHPRGRDHPEDSGHREGRETATPTPTTSGSSGGSDDSGGGLDD